MARPKTTFETYKVVFVPRFIITGMVGHNVFTQCPTEGQLLLETILKQTVRPVRVLFAQIIHVYDQTASLLSHHGPDVIGVDALVLL